MVTARDRVIGILIGNLVVFAVSSTVWPVSVAERIDPAIAAALRQLRLLLVAPMREEALAAVSATQEKLAEVERDLELTSYEPATIRPSRGWVESRARAAGEVSALCGLLLVVAGRGMPENTARRLQLLAGPLEGSEATARDADSAAGAVGKREPLSPFASDVDRLLGRLESELRPSSDLVANGVAHAAP